jgi:hypothetical protein
MFEILHFLPSGQSRVSMIAGRFGMIDIRLLRFVAVLTWLSIVATIAAQSWHDDSRYVSLGPRTGYYIVRPGSPLFHQLGLDRAPISDTADPFRHGQGSDALAFRFDRGGKLLTAPAYMAQAQVNNFYTSRLGTFIRGKSTIADVQSMFGRFRRTEQRPDGFIGYYEIEVYNPFEDQSGQGRR